MIHTRTRYPVRSRRHTPAAFALLVCHAQVERARRDAAAHEAAWRAEFWKHQETRAEMRMMEMELNNRR